MYGRPSVRPYFDPFIQQQSYSFEITVLLRYQSMESLYMVWYNILKLILTLIHSFADTQRTTEQHERRSPYPLWMPLVDTAYGAA